MLKYAIADQASDAVKQNKKCKSEQRSTEVFQALFKHVA